MKAVGALLVLVAFTLSACTLNIKYRKPDTSDDDMEQDLASCQGQLAAQPALAKQEYQEQLHQEAEGPQLKVIQVLLTMNNQI